jgi:hypothetical protein
MTACLRDLLLAWALLVLLLAAELAMSFLPIERSSRPVILVPATLMVATVAVAFMQVGRGPSIIRLFVIAALLWLGILLGLGSLDPMTRTDYPAQATNQR